MDRQKINRINELLAQLNNIDVEEKDGTVVNLGEKYGKKIGN